MPTGKYLNLLSLYVNAFCALRGLRLAWALLLLIAIWDRWLGQPIGTGSGIDGVAGQ
jgi:hypothetical protein